MLDDGGVCSHFPSGNFVFCFFIPAISLQAILCFVFSFQPFPFRQFCVLFFHSSHFPSGNFVFCFFIPAISLQAICLFVFSFQDQLYPPCWQLHFDFVDCISSNLEVVQILRYTNFGEITFYKDDWLLCSR